MSKITIKNGELKLESNKNMLVNIEQTSDGIVFNFKDGSHYYVISNHMPIETKEKVKQADTLFESANLVIDVNNFSNPVYVDLT